MKTYGQNLLISMAAVPLLSGVVFADVTFTFPNGNTFDGGGVGASQSSFDPVSSVVVTLSTIDIQGQDGSLASSGAADSGHTTFSNNLNALGVDSVIDVDDNDGGNEARDFNPGEAWIFSFDTEVVLNELDFAGWTAQAEVTVSSAAFTSVVYSEDGSGTGTVDMGGVTVPAGTTITLEMTSDYTDGNDTAIRLSYLDVLAQAGGSTGADLVYNGGDGGAWDLVAANFLDEGTAAVFQTGDNVTFDAVNSVVVDEGEISAGVVSANHESGAVVLQGGILEANFFENTGAGTVAVENWVDSEVVIVSGGTLEVRDGGILDAGSLLISNEAVVSELLGGDLAIAGETALGTGGGFFHVEGALSLGPVTNSEPGTYFIKDGPGTLTLTSGLGTQTTGPVGLYIDAGTLVATGTGSANQINLSGDTFFNGQFILDGPLMMLHASNLTGTGSILIQSPSTIKPRLNQGVVTVSLPITLGADLVVDSQSGNNELRFLDVITGPYNVDKVGNGLVTFDAEMAYTGETHITAGRLSLVAASLEDSAAVTLAGNGVLALPHGLGDTVDSLFIDEVQMPAGTYGSSEVTEVTVDFLRDDRFAGTGYLVVANGPTATDYDGWAGAFGLVGESSADDDGDGVSNGDEYAFGLDPSSGSSVSAIGEPLDAASGSFTFTRRNPALYETGLGYRYYYSTTLSGEWTEFTDDAETIVVGDGGDPVEAVSVTLPPSLLGNEKLFVRVIAQQ